MSHGESWCRPRNPRKASETVSHPEKSLRRRPPPPSFISNVKMTSTVCLTASIFAVASFISSSPWLLRPPCNSHFQFRHNSRVNATAVQIRAWHDGCMWILSCNLKVKKLEIFQGEVKSVFFCISILSIFLASSYKRSVFWWLACCMFPKGWKIKALIHSVCYNAIT